MRGHACGIALLIAALGIGGCGQTTRAVSPGAPRFAGFDIPLDSPPIPITRVQPSYPDAAREAGIDGRVVVEALVNEQGTVSSTRMLVSIPLLDDAAQAAVRQWIFKPATAHRRPVAATIAIPVNFSLH